MLGLALPLIAVGVKALSIPPTNGPTQSILIISEPPSSSFDPCLRSAYYGAYGGSSTEREYIFLPTDDCLIGPATSALSSGDIQSGSITYIDPAFHGPSGGRLVWVGQAGVAPDMAENESGNILQSWAGIQHKAAETTLIKVRRDEEWNTGEHEYQSHYSTGPTPRMITMVHASAKSLLLAVPEEYLPILDTLLPRHLVPVALPLQPYAGTTQAEGGAWEPVPEYLAKNLANITKNLKFDPKLDKVMNDGLEVDQLRRDIRWLTGEGPSGIESRHSFTEGALKAARYIKGIAEGSGAKCDLHHFLPHFAPNVLCSYPSTTNSTELVILSAHYDSRGSFGLTRAPGGDDDGSGSGHLLQIARAIGKLGIRFEKKVAFAWHAGEEQGLYGSHYVAEKLKKENATVLLQVQADMLGYHVPGEPLQLGLPESIETPEASALLHAISQLYSPELVLGKTAACCSDHQSFLSYGFPATAVFERNGPIADPMYHNTGDVSQREGYDLEQILSIAKVTMGAVLTVAGWKRE